VRFLPLGFKAKVAAGAIWLFTTLFSAKTERITTSLLKEG
jgi:hypothetical protein